MDPGQNKKLIDSKHPANSLNESLHYIYLCISVVSPQLNVKYIFNGRPFYHSVTNAALHLNGFASRNQRKKAVGLTVT